MNTYEREAIGNIIIMRNIVFQNNINGRKEIDHAWKSGRPCVIIYSDDKYDYFLTLKSNITHSQQESHYFPLNENNFLYRNISRYGKYNIKDMRKRKTKGEVNLESIYKAPISGHDEIGKITFETYKQIIDKLKDYHKMENLDEIITKAKISKGRA